MDKTSNNLTERLVIAVTLKQKREIHDRATTAGLGVGEYLRTVLFPDATQAELDTLQRRVEKLEQQVKTLEALIGRGEQA